MVDPVLQIPTAEMKRAIDDIVKAMEAQKARGWIGGAYGESFELLKVMEDRLSKGRFRRVRLFYDPVIIGLRGLEQMAISYGRVHAATFALGLAGLWLSGFFPAEYQRYAQLATLVLNACAALTLMFAAPSTYCSAGTNAKHVSDIKNKLENWSVDSPTRVDLVVKNVKIFEERTRRRLTIFRWLLGSSWALYVSPLISDAIKKWGATTFSLPELVALFPPMGFLLLGFLAIEAYGRGVDVIFRSIELGANERLADLDRAARLKKSEQA